MSYLASKHLTSTRSCLCFVLMQMCEMDGKSEPSEIQVMLEMLDEWDLGDDGNSMAGFEACVAYLTAGGSVDEMANGLTYCCDRLKDELSDPKAVITDLAKISLADGDISSNERRYVEVIMNAFGLTLDEITGA